MKLDALNITKLCFGDQYFSTVFHHSESCEMFPSILHSKEYIGICLNKKKNNSKLYEATLKFDCQTRHKVFNLLLVF